MRPALRLRSPLARAALLLSFAAAEAQTSPGTSPEERDGKSCGLYPPEVSEQVYAGFSGCPLRRFGQKPLWKNLPGLSHRKYMRFTVTDGHFRFFRFVSIVELENGKGRIEVGGADRLRKRWMPHEMRRYRLSAAELERIDTLARASGTWDFEFGSWDGDEIYLHCRTLDMEQADRSGYRHSSVNISCNRPRALVPLLEEVERLARLEEGDLQ